MAQISRFFFLFLFWQLRNRYGYPNICYLSEEHCMVTLLYSFDGFLDCLAEIQLQCTHHIAVSALIL